MFLRTYCLSAFVLLVSALYAQELPLPSPHASVTLTLGITDIELSYSSPAVKGRQIWGELVPYGEVWRSGANEATTIRFAHDVSVDGNRVPAGTYALFTLPTEGEWTVILNRNWDQSGTDAYDPTDDIARVSVQPEEAPFRERLAYHIEQTADDEARISLHWEKKQISFSIDVPTDELVKEQIQAEIAELEQAWVVYARSAQWTLENTGDETQAFEWIGRSLDLQKAYYNTYVKAQMLAHIGDTKAAAKTAQEALKLGEVSDSEAYRTFWKAQIESDLAKWKNPK